MDTTLGPIVILQSVTPVEPLLQKVVHRMYCPPLLTPYAKFVLFGECIMVSGLSSYHRIGCWPAGRPPVKPLAPFDKVSWFGM